MRYITVCVYCNDCARVYSVKVVTCYVHSPDWISPVPDRREPTLHYITLDSIAESIALHCATITLTVVNGESTRRVTWKQCCIVLCVMQRGVNPGQQLLDERRGSFAAAETPCIPIYIYSTKLLVLYTYIVYVWVRV